MPKYINADDLLRVEEEGYLNAQNKVSDGLKRRVKHIVHMKINWLINDAPAADVLPERHGEWRDSELLFASFKQKYICSECGYNLPIETKTRYCPLCGAKMDGKDGDGNG